MGRPVPPGRDPSDSIDKTQALSQVLLQRRLAAIRRSEEEKKRARLTSERAVEAVRRSEAASTRARVSRRHADRIRDRLAGRQGSQADDAEAAKRDQPADPREREWSTARPGPPAVDGSAEGPAGDGPAPGDTFTRLRWRQDRLRVRAAELAEQIADGAEAFAACLEASAERGDRERRLASAESERRVAGRLRQRAARWRAEGEEGAGG